MEFVRTLCEWGAVKPGLFICVVVWVTVLIVQSAALHIRHKGWIGDKTLGWSLLACRCYGALTFSFIALAFAGHGYFADVHHYYIGAGLIGILSLMLWWKALKLGTAVPHPEHPNGG